MWQAIKWPLRKALLGLYIAIQAVRRHKLVTLVVSAMLIGLIVTTLIVRQLTLTGSTALAIEKPSLPAIPVQCDSLPARPGHLQCAGDVGQPRHGRAREEQQH